MSEKKEKKQGGIKSFLYRVAMLICLGVFVYSGYRLYEIWNGNHQISQDVETLHTYLTKSPEGNEEEPSDFFEVDWNGLKAENPRVEAWIIVPGTNISYPVVQGDDNSYYLDHTYTGAENRMGSVFMDAEAPADFSADNTLVYGHSVDIGGMFTDLKYFADPSFVDEHPYFWLLTPNQNYQCEVLSLYQGNDTGAVYTTSFGDFRQETLDKVQQESTVYRDIDTDNCRFVSLSTCNLNYGFDSDQRYVLMAALREWNEPIHTSEETN